MTCLIISVIRKFKLYYFFSLEPCSPTGVTSQLDCLAGTSVVSWTSSANAENYTAKATSMNGSLVFCYGAGTSCTLMNLDCNQIHVVTVTASDDTCTSAESQSSNQEPGMERICQLNICQ